MKQKEIAVDILCASFEKSLAVNYALKTDSKKAQRLRYFFNWAYDITHSQGQVILNAEQNGVVLLLDSERRKSNLSADLKLLYKAVSSVSKAVSLLVKQAKLKRFYPNQPHHHLWFIGIHPTVQGMGKGSALLDTVVQQYPDDTIYLETATRKNISFYRRNGFQLTQTVQSVEPRTWIFTT